MKLEKITAALIACACVITAASVSAFAAPDESVPDTGTSSDSSAGESSVTPDPDPEDSGSDAGTSPDGSVGESTSDPVDDDLIDDDTPAYIYTWNVPAAETEDSGWVSKNITQNDFIGSVKPSDVEAIVIKGAKADDEIGIGYNTTRTDTKAEGYYQSNDDDENWPTNTVTVKGSDIDWANYYVQLFSNTGEATTVTVSVYSKADDTESDSTPSESESSTPSDSSSDSNSGGLVTDSSSVSNTAGSGNPGTGVAMTFIPAIIAGAVVIATKKRK